MKRTFIFLTLLLSMALTLSGVRAEEGSTETTDTTETSTREKTWEEMQAAREEAKAAKQEAIESFQQLKVEKQQILDEHREEAKEEMQTHRVEVCEEVQARINNRLNQYEENKEQYHSRYSGISDKVTDLADKLEDKGCDVDQIRTDLDSFEDYIETFAAAFRVFVTDMQSARGYACDEIDSDFRAQVQESKNQVLAMRQAAKELHSFVLNTLKPHMRTAGEACKAQLQTQSE
jgi:chromosome segregation ATPase